MRPKLVFWGTVLSFATLVGCGGSSGNNNSGSGSSGGGGTTTPADFTLAVSPATIAVVPGGGAQTLTVAATPANGFNSSVMVTMGSLPAGVTATPANLSLAAGA